jgi:hypothetical protein
MLQALQTLGNQRSLLLVPSATERLMTVYNLLIACRALRNTSIPIHTVIHIDLRNVIRRLSRAEKRGRQRERQRGKEFDRKRESERERGREAALRAGATDPHHPHTHPRPSPRSHRSDVAGSVGDFRARMRDGEVGGGYFERESAGARPHSHSLSNLPNAFHPHPPYFPDQEAFSKPPRFRQLEELYNPNNSNKQGYERDSQLSVGFRGDLTSSVFRTRTARVIELCRCRTRLSVSIN